VYISRKWVSELDVSQSIVGGVISRNCGGLILALERSHMVDEN